MLAPQRVSFVQHCDTLFLHFDHSFSCKLTISWPLHWHLQFWITILLFTMGQCGLSFFPVVCRVRKARSLQIFRMSFKRFVLTSCGFVLCFHWISFFLHCAAKLQAVVVTSLHFISQKSASCFMLFIFKNNIRYFQDFNTQLYIFVIFWKKRRK